MRPTSILDITPTCSVAASIGTAASIGAAPVRPANFLAMLLLVAATGGLRGSHAQGATEALRIGFIGSAESGAAAQAAAGAALGADEARYTAALLGHQFELVPAEAPDVESARQVAGSMADDHGVYAIVGGFSEASCRTLSEAAEALGVLFVNVGCPSDALRGNECSRYTFHIAASEAMRRDARVEAGDSNVALWHASLFKYGAAQLNERFEAAGAVPIDSDLWAGWMAVKVLSEAAFRARTTDPSALIEYMEQARFDGHKGKPLTFRTWDHQLRQPLYLVGASEVLGEVPDPAVEDGGSPQEVLDAYGHGADESECRFDEPSR